MFQASEKLGKPLLIGSMVVAFLIMANKKAFAQEIQDSRTEITESIKEEKDTASLGKIEGFDPNDENNDITVQSYFLEHFPEIEPYIYFNPHTGIVNGSNELALVDMETGEIKWITQGLSDKLKHPVLPPIGEFLCTGEEIYKIDMETGELSQPIKCSKSLSEQLGKYRLTNSEGIVVSDIPSDTMKVAQFDMETGEIEWIRYLKEIEAENEVFEKEIEVLEKEIEALKKENEASEKEIEALKKEFEVLKKEVKAKEEKNEALKKIFEEFGMYSYSKNYNFTKEQNEELDNLGICNHHRFGAEMVDNVIRNRKLLQEGGVNELQEKPIVVCIFASKDDDEVFTRQNIEGFKEKHNVLYYEVGHEDSLYKYLDELEPLKGKIEMLVIGAHSNQFSMSLGGVDADTDSLLVDIDSLQRKIRVLLGAYPGQFSMSPADIESLLADIDSLRRKIKRINPDSSQSSMSLSDIGSLLEYTDSLFTDMELRFGKDFLEKRAIDFSDEKELEKYSDLFEKTKIILVGCSAGKGKDSEDNVANFLSRNLCSKSQEIYSSTVNMGNYFLFDKEGNFIKAHFLDPIYYSKYRELFNEDQIYITKGKNYKE